jgi:conserved oligomeric Golgi complex subunit 8
MMTASTPVDERLVASAALDAAEEQLQTLTASYAGTFVSVERRSAAYQGHLQQLLVDIETVLAQASTSLHVLEQDGTKEDETLAALAERHRIRRRTLLQHSSLLELLELPNIMDACVRSNLYEEALQIAAFANTLARRHSTDNTAVSTLATSDADANRVQSDGDDKKTVTKSSANTVVQQVIRQIRSRQVDLRRHLIGRLRMAVTMPECLEVVTAVRRLNAIDLENRTTSIGNSATIGAGNSSSNVLEQQHTAMEFQLQISFLEARDVWLDSKTTIVRHGSLGPQEETLLDAIERYRTRMFEVMTQFNAIFRAQHVAASSTQLFAVWTSRRVQSFLLLLRTELTARSQHQQPDAAAIRDAVEASVFFGTSLGRLGADFTSQLPAIFEPVLLQTVTQFWTDGVTQLRETLTICREAGVAGPLSSETGSMNAEDGREADALLSEDAPMDGPQLPPKVLLTLPPLARLINAVLSGLNELRRCLLPGIFPSLRQCLEEQVLRAVESELLMNERAVLVPGLRGEAASLRSIATEMQAVFRDVVEPYLRGSLEAAIGNSSAASKHHQVLRDKLLRRERKQLTEAIGSQDEPSETLQVVENIDAIEPDNNEVGEPVLIETDKVEIPIQAESSVG